MRPAGAILLLLAGCGGGSGDGNTGVTVNQLKQLSTPREGPVVDLQVAARPQPLSGADLRREGMERPACDFRTDGHVLLAATPSDAIARINGRLYHFNHSSPVGPTGGFFEDRQLSISVGRTAETATEAGDSGRWPARLIVTNRRANAQVRLDGVWRCG
jgi:hypothetical protein